MVVHEHALVKVREDMPLDLASLIGCSVVTGYGAVAHTARIASSRTTPLLKAIVDPCIDKWRRLY